MPAVGLHRLAVELLIPTPESPPSLIGLTACPERSGGSRKPKCQLRRAKPEHRVPNSGSRAPSPESAYSADVQFGHFLAAIGIAVAQCGQSFVVGAAAGAGRRSALTHFTTMKIAKATIRNSMIVFRNTP